ncbi:MAG: peptide deformylase [Desulfobacteraceae bacterium]|nr:peptide deformylase [Desulfobacteraceae bacterium]
MSVLDVVIYPHPILRQELKDVEKIDEDLKNLAIDMADTMYESRGVGLAANQINSEKRIIVFDPDPDPEVRNYTVLVNPHIIEKEGSQISKEEGCLSLPGIRADVKRYERVKVKALNLEGEEVEIDGTDLVGIILQHEIDHLNGKVFIDRLSSLKKKFYHKKLVKQAQ